MEVLISTNGTEQIQKKFERFGRNAGGTTAMFAQITEELAVSNERSWGRGVKLAEATVETKARKGLDPHPLVASGALKRSLTSKTGGEGAIREIGPTEMRFGTTVFYARWQNYGTKNMPKHRVLKFTTTTRKLIKSLIQRHLFDGV